MAIEPQLKARGQGNTLNSASESRNVQRVSFLVSHASAGGAQEIWVNLADGFRRRGYDVSVVALYPGRKEVRETPPGLEWRYIYPKAPRGPLDFLSVWSALNRYFRREAPDFVFTAMPAANVTAPLAARLSGARTRFAISHHSPLNTYSKALRAADSRVGGLSNISAIVCVSRAVADSVGKVSKRYLDRRQVIYNAMPPQIEALLDQLAVTRRRDAARQSLVAATGRLAEQKNYPVLIRAMRHMPNVRVRIVGAGPLENELRALAQELGVTERLELMGHRPREEALQLLAEGDVFVQPSLFEGHSLGLVEAAKLGMPLVVSDVAVQIEGVTAPDGKRCGAVVGVHDDRALAGAITRLMDDANAYKEACALSQHLAQSITFDSMLDRYEALTRL